MTVPIRSTAFFNNQNLNKWITDKLYYFRRREARQRLRFGSPMKQCGLLPTRWRKLFQRDRSTIQRHIKRIYDEGELTADSTCALFAQVQTEGVRQVERKTPIYNLDMVISVGYRVNSHRGVQFRQWATQVLKEYMIKGFVLNDDLLKNAGQGNYFDELVARIRDIRSSEKVFYRKVLEIYAISIDYDPHTSITKQFFKTVQNKMHFAATDIRRRGNL